MQHQFLHKNRCGRHVNPHAWRQAAVAIMIVFAMVFMLVPNAVAQGFNPNLGELLKIIIPPPATQTAPPPASQPLPQSKPPRVYKPGEYSPPRSTPQYPVQTSPQRPPVAQVS